MVEESSRRQELQELFRLAREGHGSALNEEYRLLDGGVEVGGPDYWAGIDASGGAVVFFPSEELPQSSYQISRLVHVEGRVVRTEDREPFRAVRVMCQEWTYFEVFTTFIEDVLERQSSGSTVVASLAQAAADWRELLARSQRGITPAEEMGLYGELRFLELLSETMGPSALELWKGPEGGRHDFMGSLGSVEIKSSGFQNGSRITVHGLTQLTPPENGFLVLAVADVDRSGTGETLSDVVSRLEALGLDVQRVRVILHGLGCSLDGSQETPFAVRRWRYWHIDEESPVITAHALPAQIVDAIDELVYKLPLTALGPEADDFRPISFHGLAE